MIHPITFDFWDKLFFTGEPVLILLYIRLSLWLGKRIEWWFVAPVTIIWSLVFLLLIFQLINAT